MTEGERRHVAASAEGHFDRAVQYAAKRLEFATGGRPTRPQMKSLDPDIMAVTDAWVESIVLKAEEVLDGDVHEHVPNAESGE